MALDAINERKRKLMAQVTITGQVVYVHTAFIAVLEDDGKTKRRWQCWDLTAEKDAMVTVTGELRTRVGKPYGEQQQVGVDHAIGKGTILTITTAATAPGDGWNIPNNTEMPF